MRSFTYTIQDEAGIHARPAGMLVKKMQACESEVYLQCGAKTVDCKKLFALMGLAVKKGEPITITASGPDADQAITTAQEFLQNNL